MNYRKYLLRVHCSRMLNCQRLQLILKSLARSFSRQSLVMITLLDVFERIKLKAITKQSQTVRFAVNMCSYLRSHQMLCGHAQVLLHTH